VTQHLVDGAAADETFHEQRENGQQPAHHRWSDVLVVDDERAARQFLARCLEGWGYSVKQAGSAAEALGIMAVMPVSVVLCDIKMPGHDGLWLTEQLRARWPQTAVVMVTAIDDLQTISQSRELGAAGYITKPIAREQLLQVLRRVTTSPDGGGTTSEHSISLPSEDPQTPSEKIEAEYTLECPAKCPACGERIAAVKAVRLLRSHVSFTSTLPRRGRVLACPHCLAVIPGELTNF